MRRIPLPDGTALWIGSSAEPSPSPPRPVQRTKRLVTRETPEVRDERTGEVIQAASSTTYEVEDVVEAVGAKEQDLLLHTDTGQWRVYRAGSWVRA